MKKIFTLLFLVFATVAAMAQGASFEVTQSMTTTDATGQLPRDNQTVVLTQNDDETWDLTMKDLALPSGLIGDITFKGVDVEDTGYSVYNIASNGAEGTVDRKQSPFNGKTLTLQIIEGQLSPKGAGSQRLVFELYCDGDDDFYAQGVFAAEAEEDIITLMTYYVGKSADNTTIGGAELGIVTNEEDGSIKLMFGGIANVNTEICYDPFYVEGLEMEADEMTGTYKLSGENLEATVDGTDDKIDIKSFSITLTPNDTPWVDSDGVDDDFGGDDPGVDPGMGESGNMFNVEGTLVIADPETGEEFTYTLSTDESIITAISGVKADKGESNATEIYSAGGVKLGKLQKGLNIVRSNGKTVKMMIK